VKTGQIIDIIKMTPRGPLKQDFAISSGKGLQIIKIKVQKDSQPFMSIIDNNYHQVND
jgi:hypothetical protein